MKSDEAGEEKREKRKGGGGEKRSGGFFSVKGGRDKKKERPKGKKEKLQRLASVTHNVGIMVFWKGISGVEISLCLRYRRGGIAKAANRKNNTGP